MTTAQLSDDIQKTLAFIISAVFLIIYFISFCSKTTRESKGLNKTVITICIVYAASYTIRYFGKMVVFIIGKDNIPSILIDEILQYALFDLGLVIGHFCL